MSFKFEQHLILTLQQHISHIIKITPFSQVTTCPSCHNNNNIHLLCDNNTKHATTRTSSKHESLLKKNNIYGDDN